MLTTLSGIVMLVRLEQSENVPPMPVIPSVIVTPIMLSLQFIKVSYDISAILCPSSSEGITTSPPGPVYSNIIHSEWPIPDISSQTTFSQALQSPSRITVGPSPSAGNAASASVSASARHRDSAFFIRVLLPVFMCFSPFFHVSGHAGTGGTAPARAAGGRKRKNGVEHEKLNTV